MNFKDIYEAVISKCKADSENTDIVGIIKTGINEAYGEIAKLEGLSVTAPLPIIDGVVNLPDDILDIKNIDPELLPQDKRDGSKIYTELDEDSLNITYSYLPEDMVNDDDIPGISLKYHKLLITYGCFYYFQFKKKADVANSYFNSYLRGLGVFKPKDSTPQQIVDVYGGMDN